MTKLIIFLSTLFLIGCGNGHNHKSNNKNIAPTSSDKPLTGRYVDEPISGVHWICEGYTQAQITNEKGEFTFYRGDDGCRFMVGKIPLRDVDIKTLKNREIIRENNETIVEFLVVLDNDANRSNGLNVTAEVTKILEEKGITKVPQSDEELSDIYDLIKDTKHYKKRPILQDKDLVKPVIKLIGDKKITINVGDDFIDKGAVATDNVDGNISDKIETTNNIDTTKEGDYNITYSVSDSAGNSAQAIRYVKVKDKPKKHSYIIGDDFKIDLSKVPNYNENAPLKDQYLSVINYLRSLKIKCNDKRGYHGPQLLPNGELIKMRWSDQLANAAKEHSEDMLANHKMQHLGSGTATDLTAQKTFSSKPSTPRERMKANGYDYKKIDRRASDMNTAENIAYTAVSSGSLPDKEWVHVIENWMKSKDGHCSNIMDRHLKDFGMAVAKGKLDNGGEEAYWTQDFGKVIIYY
jgi:hypothetical protein